MDEATGIAQKIARWGCRVLLRVLLEGFVGASNFLGIRKRVCRGSWGSVGWIR
jgi:hypothetical protein